MDIFILPDENDRYYTYAMPVATLSLACAKDLFTFQDNTEILISQLWFYQYPVFMSLLF